MQYSVTPWTEWSPCTDGCIEAKSNSPSFKTRQRFCQDESKGFIKVDNAKCAHLAEDFFQKADCSAEACPKDGGWTPWQEWEPCDQDCGEGMYSSFYFGSTKFSILMKMEIDQVSFN